VSYCREKVYTKTEDRVLVCPDIDGDFQNLLALATAVIGGSQADTDYL